MLSRKLGMLSGLLFCAATPFYVGCACGSGSCGARTAHAAPLAPCSGNTACGAQSANAPPRAESDLPPNASPGECYAKVFVPPQFETVSERICTRQASERLEIIPARYEWVEERIQVKEASTQLVEIPAQFEMREQKVQVNSGHTGWVVEKNARCVGDNQQPAQDVFCLVTTPPEYTTVRTNCLVKPASVQEQVIPAEYDVVRRQKLVSAATTKRIAIPAEFEDVQKTVMVSTGRMEWQRVKCEVDLTTENNATTPGASVVASFDSGSNQ